MGEDFSVIQVLFLAALAIFILLQLRRVLGRRTGNERPRDPFAARSSAGVAGRPLDKEAPPPLGDRAPADDGSTRIGTVAPEGSALNQALTEIQLADRSFDLDRFIGGARAAYRLLVEAFARGDKAALKPLLSPDVFASFSSVIDGRAAKGETVELKLTGIKDATITAAKLDGRQAEITVSFESEVVTVTKNSDGAVIAGDPGTVVTVIDIWSFAREVKSKTPDWILVGTDTAN
jgi:predicted lipid-binding transport protein (Tim44 family)